MNDARVLRERSLAAQEALDRSPDLPPDAAAAVLAQTVEATTYPTTAAAFYAMKALECDGEEDEGTAVSFVAVSDEIFFSLNLGSAVPPVGTIVVCHAVGSVWCFRWDSA